MSYLILSYAYICLNLCVGYVLTILAKQDESYASPNANVRVTPYFELENFHKLPSVRKSFTDNELLMTLMKVVE